MIAQKRKEDDVTMNKKLVAALLLPLVLLPLVSFAYAHFYDYVEKRYRIHVGSVEVELIYFHVDFAKMIDVDNDGVIMGDELNITIWEDPDTCTWYVQIEADPIPSGFVLNTTMKLHVTGKLPVRFNWAEDPAGIWWAGPFDYSWPDWDEVEWETISTLPGVVNPVEGPWSYKMDVYKENATGIYGPLGSTQEEYKPCNNITIVQHVNFRQPDPQYIWTQKDWQCKRILIRCYFQFKEETPQEFSSWTWTPPEG